MLQQATSGQQCHSSTHLQHTSSFPGQPAARYAVSDDGFPVNARTECTLFGHNRKDDGHLGYPSGNFSSHATGGAAVRNNAPHSTVEKYPSRKRKRFSVPRDSTQNLEHANDDLDTSSPPAKRLALHNHDEFVDFPPKDLPNDSGFPQEMFKLLSTKNLTLPQKFRLVEHSQSTQTQRLHGQLESMSRIVMKQSRILQRTMDELAEYKRREALYGSLSDPMLNITVDSAFLATFASDRPVGVMSKKLVELIHNEEVEFYPQGSFFCNRAFASLLKVELGDITHPKFCHRDIGQWKYVSALRQHPRVPLNTRFILYSGIQMITFKMPIEDRDGKIMFVKCDLHIGDVYTWFTYEMSSEFDTSLTVDGELVTDVKPIESLDHFQQEDSIMNMKTLTDAKRKSSSPTDDDKEDGRVQGEKCGSGLAFEETNLPDGDGRPNVVEDSKHSGENDNKDSGDASNTSPSSNESNHTNQISRKQQISDSFDRLFGETVKGESNEG